MLTSRWRMENSFCKIDPERHSCRHMSHANENAMYYSLLLCGTRQSSPLVNGRGGEKLQNKKTFSLLSCWIFRIATIHQCFVIHEICNKIRSLYGVCIEGTAFRMHKTAINFTIESFIVRYFMCTTAFVFPVRKMHLFVHIDRWESSSLR